VRQFFKDPTNGLVTNRRGQYRVELDAPVVKFMTAKEAQRIRKRYMG
jgi:hypothetical protein